MTIQLSRRRFLAVSGAGMAAAVAGCYPFMTGDWHHRESAKLAHGETIVLNKDLFLGYPINMTTPPDEFFSWREQLFDAGINRFAFNNVGNPYLESPIPFNTHDFEREVIQRFAQLYGFPADDNWGFISHSGTDSNMHGMYMGRTILTGRTGLTPKVYFTREAHYSIQILRDLLGMEAVQVETLPDGGMDSADLARCLAANSDRPVLVVATVGTTFKGAIDNIDNIQHALQGLESYLHLDAALFGGYLPHTEFASEVIHQTPGPAKKQRYDSIAVSCHKFFGFPSPAGLFITRKKLYQYFTEQFSRIHNPEYIHHVPGTITCSRDAVKPAEFHFFSTDLAFSKQSADAGRILTFTRELLRQMQSHLPQWQATRANDASNTVYFKKPSAAIVKKYSLATMNLAAKSGPASYAHVVVMPHVTNQIITEFLSDLESDTTHSS